MLEIKDLFVSYGMMEVLHGISLKVEDRELVSVIGPNGAGKSTLIKTVMGLVKPTSGQILYNGQDITHLPAHKRAGLGIGYVPEGRRVFAKLTVEENLRMGAYELKDKKKIAENMARVYEIFPRLGERKNQLASTMSGGEQQMLAISRALMLSPRMLLIDEVSMGLMPIMVNTCFDVIKKLNDQGITILVVEQNANKALKVADRGYVLETGDIVYSHIPVDASWDEAASRYTAMNAWLDNYRHGVDSIMNNPVATSARYMRNSSATIQNWVSDAAMEIIKALSGISNIDCAIMNKGGIRCDMPQGTVTEGVIGSMFPFDNRFVVLEMPGNELIESVKLMCGRGGDAVSKELRATYNSKGEMTGATLKGKKIDPKKTYIVATIDYLANGGDYMTPMTRCKRLFVDTQKYGNHMLDYVKRLEAAGKKIDAKDEVRIKQK